MTRSRNPDDPTSQRPRPDPDPPVDVPDGETPAARCGHCGRPFRSERGWALHLGEVHPESCTEAERAAHEEARAEEETELFAFHIKVVAALGVLSGVLVLLYMIALSGGLL